MTLCVGLKLNAGLVSCRIPGPMPVWTISRPIRKMFFFGNPGERVIVIMTAGSLSVTQTTLARPERGAIGNIPTRMNRIRSCSASSMLRCGDDHRRKSEQDPARYRRTMSRSEPAKPAPA